MDPKDVKLIDAARLQFDAVSEKARVLIYRKVLEHFQRHPDSPWSGAPLRDLEMTVREFYADLGVKYDKVFRETLPPTMQRFYDRAVQEMRTAGVRNAILGKPDSGRVKYFLDSAFEQVAMKTQNMEFQHIKALRNLTADVTRQMSVTGATRREVSKALLDRAMEIPGFEFIDKAGTKWPLKSYFNTLARTELMTAARASYDDKVTDEGFDVMKLTTSGHCCEACARFEGELFSLTGATKGLPTKQDLIDAGVFHPNCTHSYSVVPDYIRERNYNHDGTPKRKNGDTPAKSSPVPKSVIARPVEIGGPFNGVANLDSPNVKELQDFMREKWGLRDVDLSGLDPVIVQQTAVGLEKINAADPSLKLIENLRVVRAGGDAFLSVAPHFTHGEFDGYALQIGKGFASLGMRKQLEARIADFVKNGMMPNGASIESLAFHEAGHMIDLTQSVAMYASRHKISYAEACRNRNILDLIGWNSDVGTIYSKYVLEKAQKKYILKYRKRILARDMASLISKNAEDNAFELLSEAVHDFGVNGENANEISKMIVEAMGVKI